MLYRISATLFTLLALIYVSACGNKGPLYLPADKPATQSSAPSTATSETPSKPVDSVPLSNDGSDKTAQDDQE